MSFSNNFKTRMLFLDQSYNVTHYRWATFEKIWEGSERVGMRMKLRAEPHDVLAEVFVDGTIVLHNQFSRLERRVRREIKEMLGEVAVRTQFKQAHYRRDPELEVWQRKLIYVKGVAIGSIGDFADFLTKKYQPGSQQGV